MPGKCPECGQKYEPEIGFYFGAMYVSYGLGVALFVAVWLISGYFIPDASAMTVIILVLSALVLFFPLSFRLSRLVWINIFVKYRGKSKEQIEHKHT